MPMASAFTLFVCSLTWVVHGAPQWQEWRSRTIYQVLIDRFALPHEYVRCTNLNKYCGGTFAGVTRMADYIEEMGFTAIWISPITEQTQGVTWSNPDGYHGYWPKDIYKINPEFGTAQDLKALVAEFHRRGIWVMLDIVPNHMGYDDVSTLHPFNDNMYFHDCQPCIPNACDYSEMSLFQVEHCRMANLPDLNQDLPEVSAQLCSWAQWMRDTFGFDGFRVDAAKHMKLEFNRQLREASEIFTIGEFSHMWPLEWSVEVIAAQLNGQGLHSALSFPMMDAMKATFRYGNNMSQLWEVRELYYCHMPDFVQLLGNFFDSHDHGRYMCEKEDYAMYRNVITFNLMWEGIPIIYYGTEQGLKGIRDPLWHFGYSRHAPLFVFIKMINWYRNTQRVWDDNVTLWYVDLHNMVFSRAGLLLALTNVGASAGPQPVLRINTSTVPEGFLGSTLVNIADPDDVLVVGFEDMLFLTPSSKGDPMIYTWRGQAVDPRTFGSVEQEDDPHKGDGLNLVLVILFPVLSVVLAAALLMALNPLAALAAAAGRWYWRLGARQHPLRAAPAGATLVPLLGNGGASDTAPFNEDGDSLAVPLLGRPRNSLEASDNGAGGAQEPRDSGRGFSSLVAVAEPVCGVIGMERGTPFLPAIAGPLPPPGLTRKQSTDLTAHFEQMQAHMGAMRGPAAASGATQVLVVGAGAGVEQRLIQPQRANSAPMQGTGAPAGDWTPPQSPGPGPGGPLGQRRERSPLRRRLGPALDVAVRVVPPDADRHDSAAVAQASARGAGVQGGGAVEGMILHVAVEYTIPHLGLDFRFGGLGTVVDTFVRRWHGPVGLCAPLYAEAYKQPGDDAPALPGLDPLPHRFNAWVGGRLEPVDIFTLSHDNVTYFLVQAEPFRRRRAREQELYLFTGEEEMLAWLSVFNQAVALVVAHFRIRRIQLHDYHGALSLLYLHPEDRPVVLYVAHNAHYDGVFPAPTRQRRAHLYGAFALDAESCRKFVEHKGSFDVLHGLIVFLKTYQRGEGVVAVSPRYAQQVLHKLSVFWQLPQGAVRGIANGLDLAHSLAARALSVQEVLSAKRLAKAALQRRYGLLEGEQYVLMSFLGRMTEQKGVDILAQAAKSFLSRHPHVQLVVFGSVDDEVGRQADELLTSMAGRFPGRLHRPCPPAPVYLRSTQDKAQLYCATDFCICPSRFEPCGLVDIEFGWNGALVIGHDTGGLGKVEGFYFQAQSSSLAHLVGRLEMEVDRALSTTLAQRQRMIQRNLQLQFPTDKMMDQYQEVWRHLDAVSAEYTQNEGAVLRGDAASVRRYFGDRWRRLYLRPAQRPFKANQMRHAISSWLLLLMQTMTMLPAVMCLSYMMYADVYKSSYSQCAYSVDESYRAFPEPMNSTVQRAAVYFGVCALATPLWTLAAFLVPPSLYIRAVALATPVMAGIVFGAIYNTLLLNIVGIITAVVAPAGGPLIALGFMSEAAEVSEVGLRMMVVAELLRAALVALAAAVPAAVTSKTPFLLAAGGGLVAATLVAAWFCHPHALPADYKYLRLVAAGQWRLIARLRCFWLTLAMSVMDWAALLLVGSLALAVWQSLLVFLRISAATFFAVSCSICIAYGLSTCKPVQLRIHTYSLAVASLPAYTLVKAAVVLLAQHQSGLLLWVFVADLVFGARGPFLGLLAFHTLPSRETVALWQCAAMLLSNALGAALTIASETMLLVPNVRTPLIGIVALEALRSAASALLVRIHRDEDLTVP